MTCTPGGDQLRERLRQALARFIDPDDDTMLAPIENDTLEEVPVETVLDGLVAAIGRQRFPITTHSYEGFGFEAPCTAAGYGTACGETEYDHYTEKA
ncbi:hypothetical protein [Streptomyces paradoxus]|uniref:hypothetical protein n=1 Tax=Streptomyces paradoxus TaxID=66375 RepID=UPI0037F63136